MPQKLAEDFIELSREQRADNAAGWSNAEILRSEVDFPAIVSGGRAAAIGGARTYTFSGVGPPSGSYFRHLRQLFEREGFVVSAAGNGGFKIQW